MLVVLVITLCVPLVLGRPQTTFPPPQEFQKPQHQPQPYTQSQNTSTSPIPIINQSESVGINGTFNFSYETGNGIHVQEGGYIKKIQLPQGHSAALNTDGSRSAPNEEDVQVLTGEFSYTAPDGTSISLKFIADENGFHPEGAHLPTPPPIPAEIQRALSLISKPDQRSIRDESETIPASETRESQTEVIAGGSSAANVEELQQPESQTQDSTTEKP